ncbi:RNA-binding S4 domain-containing protein [Rhizobium lentis]|uniref:RNA-binding S4 domain-containing protein n=1 Tax=Rhizobium lentis TaxID=1138194 RepID=UPI001C83124B|nr:RNA-binding S4 domain-containing protein [Rhizobium lentis]MBX5135085.1 RNA-binding S4 domain-containing protein [Rhizobium lentis]MBX5140991.1 RNA-binding S4 domain-containing protein [Rhizobium lentis]MBX5153276.1 RNA-binding S4 domain-containing protein [Rhizobium lentis]MBX5178343.1 RNA-binding S4 domain-containing protein [Rhizobium lentis]
MGGETQPASGSRQRIDKWLFFTRVVKSRSLAQSHVQSGHVRINGERCSHPSQTVKPGDRVELTLERRDVILIVRLAGERRGPYEEARLLYDDQSLPPDETKRLTPFEQATRATGTGRPTKKERSAIDRLMSDED